MTTLTTAEVAQRLLEQADERSGRVATQLLLQRLSDVSVLALLCSKHTVTRRELQSELETVLKHPEMYNWPFLVLVTTLLAWLDAQEGSNGQKVD